MSDVATVKAGLREAFKALRKQGVIARQNFRCCNTCASYDIATDVGRMPARTRAKVAGAVFYHAQEAQALREVGHVYLAYGPIDVDGVGEVGRPTVEVGRMVQAALEAAGLVVVWNGQPEQKICATARRNG